MRLWYHGIAAHRAAATKAGTIARRSHDYGCKLPSIVIRDMTEDTLR
jgi:hypothetical protein